MPHLNTAISGGAGTPPVARGGASGPRRSTGGGRGRSSGDGFSTLLDDLSLPSRASASSERAGVSAPARPARVAAARAVEVSPTERRLSKPAGKPASAHAPVAPTSPVVEAPPEPRALGEPPTRLDAASGIGEVAEASATSATSGPAAVAANVAIGPPIGTEANSPFADTGDASRVTELLPVTTVRQPEPQPPTAVLPGLSEGAVQDGERPALSGDVGSGAGAVSAGSVHPPGWIEPVAVDPGGAATTDAVALVRQHPRTSSRGSDQGGSAAQAPVLATLDTAGPVDTAQESIADPDVSPVDSPVGALGDRLEAQLQAEWDEATPSAMDARAIPPRDPGAQEGQTDASHGEAGDDGAQTGSDALPDGMIAQPSTFLVPGDADGVSSEPQGSAPSHASERALESQLVQAMRVQWRGGLGEATITLRPEHVGQVRIVLRLEGGALQAHLQVEDPKVRAWVESHSEVLRSSLSAQGLDLTRLVVSDQPSDGGRREASPEERGRHGQRPQGPWAIADADEAPRFEVRA